MCFQTLPHKRKLCPTISEQNDSLIKSLIQNFITKLHSCRGLQFFFSHPKLNWNNICQWRVKLMKSWFKRIVELSLGLALWRFYTSRFYITEKPSIEERRERFLPCVVRRTAILLWEVRTLAKDKHHRTHVEGLEADSAMLPRPSFTVWLLGHAYPRLDSIPLRYMGIELLYWAMRRWSSFPELALGVLTLKFVRRCRVTFWKPFIDILAYQIV